MSEDQAQLKAKLREMIKRWKKGLKDGTERPGSPLDLEIDRLGMLVNQRPQVQK